MRYVCLLLIFLCLCTASRPLIAEDTVSTESSTTVQTNTSLKQATEETPLPIETDEPQKEDSTEKTFLQSFDHKFATYIVTPIAKVLFFSVLPEKTQEEIDNGEKQVNLPLILLILALGAVFFTFRYTFINIRLCSHALKCIRGKFDNPEDAGEISHFKALTSALSATVGLGNIAGVAVAITTGGPGAVFWMWCLALFGMSMKFSSCTLAQIYRRINDKGEVLGGPMVYLEEGLKEKGMATLGKIFGVMFAVCTLFGAIGAGNMYQSNQTYELIANKFSETPTALPFVVGIILAFLVGAVILGGIKRIGNVTSKLVPSMCVIYSLLCLWIILSNITTVPEMFASIFSQAFAPQAAFGGLLGVFVAGIQRAAFSNEAGLGSAAIAHAAAKTKEPVREGAVAMLGPFIDTIVVCTMTALAILITKAHESGKDGITVTAQAFSSIGDFAPYLLLVMVIIFAYSTIISWGYYGERAILYLFGHKGLLPYRIIYVLLVTIGPLLTLKSILNFSDVMLFSMAFPNIIGMVLLSGKVRTLAKDYIARLASGEIQEYQ